MTSPMDTTDALDRLRVFRAEPNARFRYHADALFELTTRCCSPRARPPSPIATAGAVCTCPHSWLPNTRALRDLLARHPLAGGQPIHAVNVSV